MQRAASRRSRICGYGVGRTICTLHGLTLAGSTYEPRRSERENVRGVPVWPRSASIRPRRARPKGPRRFARSARAALVAAQSDFSHRRALKRGGGAWAAASGDELLFEPCGRPPPAFEGYAISRRARLPRLLTRLANPTRLRGWPGGPSQRRQALKLVRYRQPCPCPIEATGEANWSRTIDSPRSTRAIRWKANFHPSGHGHGHAYGRT